MTVEKFHTEVMTLKRFFETYCTSKHHNSSSHYILVEYKGQKFKYDFNLCDDSFELITYAIEKLLECPHEIKPRCRSCPSPCYEKSKYKDVAKIMKYSGIKLGLSRIKKIFVDI
ncbi:nitrous oxide-stimulated promoter family protein [Arcobacter sp. FWKO B]|uniref:nitrous oxide-stimulated promoter family protein n=1 Tax=Arcobacter sp. FWKO B TaxID=2593672 RepID=UPI0018A37759|nr:nitrous oxide-stimulated promoter family protein [Arcobacter sp. FWKO B]QOG11915.1 hypothetical protein FWKOB_04005 [Arcobacter sp. FWKO B]